MNATVALFFRNTLLFCVLISQASFAAMSEINIANADQLRANGNYHKANNIYYRALSEGVFREQALYGLAEGFMQMRKYRDSIARVSELLDINPVHRDGLWLRSQACLKINDATAALNDLEKLNQMEPDNKELWLVLEYAYSLAGETAKAAAAKSEYARRTR